MGDFVFSKTNKEYFYSEKHMVRFSKTLLNLKKRFPKYIR